MRGLGYQPQDLIPGLFYQQSVEWLQDSVFPHHEAHLCPTNHILQAFPLLSGTPDWVYTSSTLGEILNNREATEKIAKWVIELSKYDIVYNSRTTIKAQALSDFMVEWTETHTLPKERELEYWTINFDGSLQLQGAGAGILITSPQGEHFKYVLQMHFPASNNATEYEALLHGLRIVTTLDIYRLRVLRDSLLIVNQTNKE
jgi:hypothetical protein